MPWEEKARAVNLRTVRTWGNGGGEEIRAHQDIEVHVNIGKIFSICVSKARTLVGNSPPS